VVRARVHAPVATRRWLAGFGAPLRLVHAAREAATAAGLPLWWERVELAARPERAEAEVELDGEVDEGHDADDAPAADLGDALRHAGPHRATAGREPPDRHGLTAWLGPEAAAVAHAIGELTGVDVLASDDGAVARGRSLVLDLLGGEHGQAAEQP
jgi:hypothetical protein